MDARSKYITDIDPDAMSTLGKRLTSISAMIAQPFVWMTNAVANWSVSFKLRLGMLFLFILPMIVALVLLETHPEELHLLLAIGLVLGIIGFVPLTNFLLYLFVGKELKGIDLFCKRLKEGDYDVHFDLPVEDDDEHEIIALKRNLNWVAHAISHRESRLQAALQAAHTDKNHYQSLSDLDPLTGLANRRCLERALEDLVTEASIFGQPLTMMFIDCDKFKSVNDNFGHQVGDYLLKKAAEIIRKNVRKNRDLPFRYGGDEFGVVCMGLTPQEATKPAERIRKEFLNYQLGECTLSAGVAGYVEHDAGDQDGNIAKFIEAADRAVYQAKNLGGNQVVLAEEEE